MSFCLSVFLCVLCAVCYVYITAFSSLNPSISAPKVTLTWIQTLLRALGIGSEPCCPVPTSRAPHKTAIVRVPGMYIYMSVSIYELHM
ncbi:uncharacterized protein GGS25DRAFT_468120 [Hypoxylon fragiforme]|uniref:uncharacterized protein n=1 Tax=Hypoxylon fragiforme TaxID=63214 RepID=UPI0020C741B3|nr:uncharacterized protein GGS25DRAFT_468120 [Hypoxylon fragiforme]KAI2613621.1 hypothetical protein GGS25DRAFT_468120 [Hypoxylon fragiforme]